MRLNNLLKKLIKKRILSIFADVVFFFFLLTVSFGVLLDIFKINLLVLLYPIVFYFLYFGTFVSLTKGYTLAGYLFRVRIVHLDNKKIGTYIYILRALYGLFSIFYFLGYIRVKVNGIGQFYYDYPFKTTVIDRGKDLSINTRKIYDKREYIYYFLAD